MKTNIICHVFMCFILLSFLSSHTQGQGSPNSNDLFSSAKEFVELLMKGDFSHAGKDFDRGMSAALPEGKLQEMWKTLQAQVGSVQKQTGVRKEISGQYDIVYVTVQCERSTFDFKIVFNSSKQIAGLFFVPTQSSVEYSPPAYVTPNSFHEKDVVVQSGVWTVPGTLTIPIGNGPFPACVLVHGSGPNDRDETIGPNKVFRDLAWGFASQGIAVLRYEKRTKAHAKELIPLKDELTVKEETIDDALAAVSLLRGTAGIDTSHIFLLGHSLGGMLIPRIGILDTLIHGFIILAGTSRPLEDVILEQTSYILSTDGVITDQEKVQLAQITAQVARVKDPMLSPSTPAKDLPLGLPAKYWLDLRSSHPSEQAKQLGRPMMILQGERDYQVTMEDFTIWRNSLSSLQNIEFKTYPKLNHLFIEGEGKSVPNEYQTAGHVAASVITDIALWIHMHEHR